MKKRKSWFDIFLTGFIVVVVLMIVGYTVASTTYRGRTQSEMDKIRAKGEPVTLHDLVPEPIPDEINAAIVYDKAFSMMSLPPYKDDSAVIDKFTSKEERDKDPKLWDEARGAVQRNQLLLDTVVEATNRPQCQFPVDWEAGFAALFPHLSRLGQVSRLQQADTLVKARAGDMEGAVKSVETGLKVSQIADDGRTLISHMVRIAMLKITIKSLKEAIVFDNLDEAQTRRLDSALSQIDLHSGFVKVMLGERAIGLSGFDLVRNQGVGYVNNLTSGGIDSISQLPAYLESTAIGAPLLNADKSCYLRLMTKQIELARQPYWKSAKSVANTDPATQAPSYATLTKMLVPIYSRARLSSETGAADVAVTRVGLGLIAFKNRFGVYPQSLAELQPKLGWVLPKDPFDGKDLKYKKTANGFVVYSIGSNMLDEGGKEPDLKSNDQYNGDVVWKVGN